MRILHFNQFRSNRGGVESYIADVMVALKRLGHASHLVSFTPGDPAEIAEVTSYVPLPDWPGAIDTAAAAINEIIQQVQPDVAYIHAVYHPALIKWLGQRLRSVAYIHAPYPVCPGSAQYLRRSARICPHSAGAICLINAQLEKCCWGRDPVKHWRLLQRTRSFTQAYHELPRIIVGSEFMRELIVRGGAPADKIVRLAPILIDPQQLPEQSAADRATVLYAGRLTAEKGIAHLIQALAAVPMEWRLLVAGDGPERKPGEALARKLGVADRIEFLGWLDNQDLARRYRQCTLVAVPSLWPEPFGRVGPEASIHGKPVVAYATGGIADWLTDGQTGYLVAPGNIARLRERLQQLLESPGLCRQMGDLARRTAKQQWAADSHIEQLLCVFEEALKQHDRVDDARPWRPEMPVASAAED
jgi:glycosyltransferase involved in cell wall biosynthesis